MLIQKVQTLVSQLRPKDPGETRQILAPAEQAVEELGLTRALNVLGEVVFYGGGHVAHEVFGVCAVGGSDVFEEGHFQGRRKGGLESRYVAGRGYTIEFRSIADSEGTRETEKSGLEWPILIWRDHRKGGDRYPLLERHLGTRGLVFMDGQVMIVVYWMS